MLDYGPPLALQKRDLRQRALQSCSQLDHTLLLLRFPKEFLTQCRIIKYFREELMLPWEIWKKTTGNGICV